jgi:hypothetical protein
MVYVIVNGNWGSPLAVAMIGSGALEMTTTLFVTGTGVGATVGDDGLLLPPQFERARANAAATKV